MNVQSFGRSQDGMPTSQGGHREIHGSTIWTKDLQTLKICSGRSRTLSPDLSSDSWLTNCFIQQVLKAAPWFSCCTNYKETVVPPVSTSQLLWTLPHDGYYVYEETVHVTEVLAWPHCVHVLCSAKCCFGCGVCLMALSPGTLSGSIRGQTTYITDKSSPGTPLRVSQGTDYTKTKAFPWKRFRSIPRDKQHKHIRPSLARCQRFVLLCLCSLSPGVLKVIQGKTCICSLSSGAPWKGPRGRLIFLSVVCTLVRWEGLQGKTCLFLCSLSPGKLKWVPGEGFYIPV